MFRVELIERRLKLIFEVRRLRIFKNDAVIEAKWFILRENSQFFSFSLPWLWRHFGVCEDLFEEWIFFENLWLFLFLCDGSLLGDPYNEIVLVINVLLIIEESYIRTTGCWGGRGIFDRFGLPERIIKLFYLLLARIVFQESLSFQLAAHAIIITMIILITSISTFQGCSRVCVCLFIFHKKYWKRDYGH